MENEDNDVTEKQGTIRTLDESNATLQSKTSKSWITSATEGEMARETWYYTWRAMRERFYPHYVFYPQDPGFWDDADVYEDNTIPMGYGISYNSLTRIPMNKPRRDTDTSTTGSRRLSAYRKSCTYFLIVIGILLLLTATIPVLLHLFLGKEQEHPKPEGVVHTRLELERLEYTPEMSNTSHPEFETLQQSLQHEIDEVFSKSDVKRYYKGSTIVEARNKSSNVQVHVDLHFDPINRKIPLYRQLVNILHSVPRDVNDSRVGVLGKYRFRINSVDMYDTDLIYPLQDMSKEQKNGYSTTSINGNNGLTTTSNIIVSSSQAANISNDLIRINISPNEKDNRVQRPLIQQEVYNDSTTSLLTTTKQHMSNNDSQTEAPVNDVHQTIINSTLKTIFGGMFTNNVAATTYNLNESVDSLDVTPPTIFPSIGNLDSKIDFSYGKIIVIKGSKRNNFNSETTPLLANIDSIDDQSTTATDAHETISTGNLIETLTDSNLFSNSSHETEISTQPPTTPRKVSSTGSVYPNMELTNQASSHIFAASDNMTFSPIDEYIDDYLTETPAMRVDLSTIENYMPNITEYWRLPEINVLSTTSEPFTTARNEVNDLTNKQRHRVSSTKNTLALPYTLSKLGTQGNITEVNTQSHTPLPVPDGQAIVQKYTPLIHSDSTPSIERAATIATVSNVGVNEWLTDQTDTVSTTKSASSNVPAIRFAHPSRAYFKTQINLPWLESNDKIITEKNTPSSNSDTTPFPDKSSSVTTNFQFEPKTTGHDTDLQLTSELNKKKSSVLYIVSNKTPQKGVFTSTGSHDSVGSKIDDRVFIAATPSYVELGMHPVTSTADSSTDMSVLESSVSNDVSESTSERGFQSTSSDSFVVSKTHPITPITVSETPPAISNMAQFISRILIPKSRIHSMTFRSKDTKLSTATQESSSIQPKVPIISTVADDVFATESTVSNKMTTRINSSVKRTSKPSKPLKSSAFKHRVQPLFERATFTFGWPIMPLDTKPVIGSTNTVTTTSFKTPPSDRSKIFSFVSELPMNMTTTSPRIFITQKYMRDKYFSSTSIPDKAESLMTAHLNAKSDVTAKKENMITASMLTSTEAKLASFASPVTGSSTSSAKAFVIPLSTDPIVKESYALRPSTGADKPALSQNASDIKQFASMFSSNISIRPSAKNESVLTSAKYSATTTVGTSAETSTMSILSTKYVPSIKYLWTVNLDNFARPVVKEEHKENLTAMEPNAFAIKDAFVRRRFNYKTSTPRNNFIYPTRATSTPSNFRSNSSTSVSQAAMTHSSKSILEKYRSPKAATIPLSVTNLTTVALQKSTPIIPQYKPDIRYLWTAGLDVFSDLYNKGNVIKQPDTKWKAGTFSNDILSNQPAFVVGGRDFKVIKGDSLQPKETLIISDDRFPVSFSNWPALDTKVTSQKETDQQNVEFENKDVPSIIGKENITSSKSEDIDNLFIKENMRPQPNYSEKEITTSDNERHKIKSLLTTSSLVEKSTTPNLLSATFISRDRTENGNRKFFDISNRLESLSSRKRPDTSFLDIAGRRKRKRKQGFNIHTTPMHILNMSTLPTPTNDIIKKTTEHAKKESTKQSDTFVPFTLNAFNAEAGAKETVQTTISSITDKTSDSAGPVPSSTNFLMFTKRTEVAAWQANASSTDRVVLNRKMTSYKENIRVTKAIPTAISSMRSKLKQTTETKTDIPVTAGSILSIITTMNTTSTTPPADIPVISKTFRDTSLNGTQLPEIIFTVNTTALIGKPLAVSWKFSKISGWSSIVLRRVLDVGDTETIGVISSTTKVPSSEFSRLKISSKSEFNEDIAKVVIDIPQVLCVDAGTYIAEIVENEILVAEQKQTLNVYGAPEARVVVPDNLIEGDPVTGVKCIAAIGHPPGKLFLRVKYQDSDIFINSLIRDPSKNINYPLSGACKPVAVVNFEDVLDQSRDLNNTLVQCGVTDTPAITSLFRVVMSEYEYIRQIPAEVCGLPTSTLIPHLFNMCSRFIDCSTMTVTSCPEGSCFDPIPRRCVQQVKKKELDTF